MKYLKLFEEKYKVKPLRSLHAMSANNSNLNLPWGALNLSQSMIIAPPDNLKYKAGDIVVYKDI